LRIFFDKELDFNVFFGKLYMYSFLIGFTMKYKKLNANEYDLLKYSATGFLGFGSSLVLKGREHQ